jgi:hypothetical protein
MLNLCLNIRCLILLSLEVMNNLAYDVTESYEKSRSIIPDRKSVYERCEFSFIHSFRSLSYDRSIDSSKASTTEYDLVFSVSISSILWLP